MVSERPVGAIPLGNRYDSTLADTAAWQYLCLDESAEVLAF
ncbi:MAG: hypothetical protein ACYC5M_00875 [Anaerolineae bacterium]